MDDAEDAVPARHSRALLAHRVIAGLAPILLTAWCLLHLQHGTTTDLLAGAVLATCYVLAFRTLFTSTRGATVPTEPVLVAMLMALPVTWVPPLVLLAVVAGSVDDDAHEGLLWWQVVLSVARQSWVMIGPVVVMLALGETTAGNHRPFLITSVIGVQLAVDAALVLAEGLLTRTLAEIVQPLTWMMSIDGMLAVVGYCIAAATHEQLPGLALIAAPVVLVRLLSRDREQYFSEAQEMKSAYSEANHEARRDPMTGLLNRRGWDETLAETLARLRSSPEPMMATILAADLDRLKFANDTYGHLAGDSLICGFADLLEQCLPSQAALARLGGDEYAVIITGPAAHGAADLIGTVRQALRAAPSVGPVRISASLGQATYPPAADLQAAVDAADHAARVDKEMRRMTRGHHQPRTESA